MRLSSRRECRKIGTASSGAPEEVTSFLLMYLQYPSLTMLQVHRHLPPLLTIPIKGSESPFDRRRSRGSKGQRKTRIKGSSTPNSFQDGEDTSKCLPVTHRLRYHIREWKRFTKNPTVLSLIQEGLKLSFMRRTMARQSLFLRCNSPLMKKTLIQTIKRFLKEKIIEPVMDSSKEELISFFFS